MSLIDAWTEVDFFPMSLGDFLIPILFATLIKKNVLNALLNNKIKKSNVIKCFMFIMENHKELENVKINS